MPVLQNHVYCGGKMFASIPKGEGIGALQMLPPSWRTILECCHHPGARSWNGHVAAQGSAPEAAGLCKLPSHNCGHSGLMPGTALVLCRWVSLRLQAISILFIFATAIFVVLLLRDSPGLAGLAMTSALGTTGVTQWLVRQATRLEVQMNRSACLAHTALLARMNNGS